MIRLRKYPRIQSISPDVRSYEKRKLTQIPRSSRSRFGSKRDAKKIYEPLDIENEYKNYILRFRNIKSKNSYCLELDGQIKKVKYFNQLLRTEKETADHEKILKENMMKVKEKLQKEEEDRIEKEKLRIQQEKIKEEMRIKEIIKQQGLREWMASNMNKFDEKKKQIKKDLDDALKLQKLNIEKQTKINQIRYEDIIATIENGKEIDKNLIFVNIKRDILLRSIQDRLQQEESEKVSIPNTIETIKVKLNQSQALNEINKCFDSDNC